jgi:sugar/nucleoside kinase (ribokinase family)
MGAPRFVAIGHVTLDRFGDTIQPGGTALYAAIAAHRLGVSAGILTRHGDDFPLEMIPPRIEVVSLPSAHTTIFRHEPGDAQRALAVEQVAEPIGAGDLPDDWRDAQVVLLGPVIDEVDPLLVTGFADATVGGAAQGWLRRRARDGQLVSAPWRETELLASRVHALFVSDEDIRGQEAATIELFQQIPVGVITAGRLGALLFVNGERYEVHPYGVTEVDATGAGDVFATMFMLHADREGDPWEAATYAACAAALSVEGRGPSAIPDAGRLAQAVEHYRRGLSHLP